MNSLISFSNLYRVLSSELAKSTSVITKNDLYKKILNSKGQRIGHKGKANKVYSPVYSPDLNTAFIEVQYFISVRNTSSNFILSTVDL